MPGHVPIIIGGPHEPRSKGKLLLCQWWSFVPQPEAAYFIQDGFHVHIKPNDAAEEKITKGSSSQESRAETIHSTRMRPVACVQNGFFPECYMWAKRAEERCATVQS